MQLAAVSLSHITMALTVVTDWPVVILLIRVHAIWFEKKLILALLLAAYIVSIASSFVSWLDEENFL